MHIEHRQLMAGRDGNSVVLILKRRVRPEGWVSLCATT
jgi:hypothetical protein